MFALWSITMIVFLTGCGPQLANPRTLEAPYARNQLWGVAPFSNESGVSIVNATEMADTMAQEAQQVRGVNTIPVNRIIQAMRQLDITSVTSHGDALTLMNVLRLDGLVIGTITAFDPYRPMKLGMAVQLYARPSQNGFNGLDPRDLVRSTAGREVAGDFGPPRPVAQAAGVFDASNHGTLQRLNEYSSGRDEPDSAYGRDIYLVSMDLYAQFVCYRLLDDLLAFERSRLEPAAEDNQVTR